MKKAAFALICLVFSSFAALGAEELGRDWTIYLVQHTHTDIGYTLPQSEILAAHLHYIDYAIDFCDLTKDYPEGERFKWTCEVSWPVEQYVKLRPASQVARLRDCVRRGQIEVAGMFLNFAEVADEAGMRYYFHPVRTIRDAGIDITLAMQNDVNGIPWCATDYLHDLGVKYMWVGSNKTISLLPFKTPTIFRWVSPSGEEIIAFRSMHYMQANFWGIEKGDTLSFRKGAEDFLAGLERDGYPYSEIGVQNSGFFSDNCQPSMKCCDFVRQWNATHDNPKLKIATASEFLDHICETYGTDDMPVERVAWPDWWTDGFGSAARETGESRKAHASMLSSCGLMSMAQLCGTKVSAAARRSVEDVYTKLGFYDEHTFGAAESIDNPSCWNSVSQFCGKASYAWAGHRDAQLTIETAAGLLDGCIPPVDGISVTVFNPLLWKRDAIAEFYLDYGLLGKGQMCSMVDENGENVPVQLSRTRVEGRYFKLFAKDVPSLGYKTFKLIVNDAPETAGDAAKPSEILENEYYRIVVDPKKGGITSITDKLAGDRELVDCGSEYPFGAFIYETMEDRMVLQRECAAHGISREVWSGLTLEKGPCGEIYESVILKGKSSAADSKGVSCEIRLYKDAPKIELAYVMVRPDDYKANSTYVAFPFTRRNPSLVLDVQGGVMHPGVNQLEGSSTEWNTLQNYVAARGSDHQIVIGSREMPIIMLGDLLGGEFQYHKSYDSPTLYSWVTNNYWFTNFKASESGEFNWSYNITSSTDTSDAFAARTTLSDRVDFYARIIRERKAGKSAPMSGSLLSIDAPDCIVASNIAPATFRRGMVLQIRNTSTESAGFSIRGASGRCKTFFRVNAIEEKIGRRCRRMTLPAGADVFVYIRK